MKVEGKKRISQEHFELHFTIAMSEIKCRAFIVHKPIHVLSSTVDAGLTNVFRGDLSSKRSDARTRQQRLTIYDIVRECGFPTDCGLVGRLDYETSGIMLFTDHTELGSAIRDPVDDSSEFFGSSFKTKEYHLQLLPRKGMNPTTFDAASFSNEMSEPFTFRRFGVEYKTSRADCKVLRIRHEESLSFGQSHLGWIIEVSVIIREGKHHQIRRMASRGQYHVHSLCRVRIANILSIDTVPNPGNYLMGSLAQQARNIGIVHLITRICFIGDCRWLTPAELHILFEEFKLDPLKPPNRKCASHNDEKIFLQAIEPFMDHSSMSGNIHTHDKFTVSADSASNSSISNDSAYTSKSVDSAVSIGNSAVPDSSADESIISNVDESP